MNYNLDFISKGMPRKVAQMQTEKPLYTFFQDVLFGDGEVMGNDKMDQVIFDWRKGTTRPLPEESIRGQEADRVNYKSGFNSDMVTPYYYNKKDAVDISDADTRVFGEEINSEDASQQRVADAFAAKTNALKEGNIIAKERMSADAVFDGKVNNLSGVQTFPMKASLLALSGANLYSDPIKCISDAANAIRKCNKEFMVKSVVLNPDDAYRLLTSSAGKSVIKKDELNLVKFQFGTMVNGLSPYGMVSTPFGDVELYAYYGTDPTDANYVPQGKAIILGASKRVGKMGYGRLKAFENNKPRYVVAKERMVAFVEGYGDDAQYAVQYQSAPIPIITNIDGYGVITGIPATV